MAKYIYIYFFFKTFSIFCMFYTNNQLIYLKLISQCQTGATEYVSNILQVKSLHGFRGWIKCLEQIHFQQLHDFIDFSLEEFRTKI